MMLLLLPKALGSNTITQQYAFVCYQIGPESRESPLAARPWYQVASGAFFMCPTYASSKWKSFGRRITVPQKYAYHIHLLART